MKFRKKPIVIEAIQWTGENEKELIDFMLQGGRDYAFCGNGTIDINTLEGVHKAKHNDWIIKGIAGEFYPCKPDIFEKTYEKVV